MKHNIPTLVESVNYLIQQASSEQRVGIIEEIQQAIYKRKVQIVDMIGVDIFDPNPQIESQRKREEIAQYIFGSQIRDIRREVLSETEAVLQRVEELKQKYTPEKIMEMRKLRAEVEEILSKIIAIDKDKSEKLTDANRQKLKQQVLQSYGIPKYRGKKLDFDPIDFIKRTDTYGKFIEAGVIFKADIRKMDKELVAILNQEISRNHKIDPLMTEEQFTEMKAAGIFGYEKQGVARGNIATRKINRDRMRLFTEALSTK